VATGIIIQRWQVVCCCCCCCCCCSVGGCDSVASVENRITLNILPRCLDLRYLSHGGCAPLWRRSRCRVNRVPCGFRSLGLLETRSVTVQLHRNMSIWSRYCNDEVDEQLAALLAGLPWLSRPTNVPYQTYFRLKSAGCGHPIISPLLWYRTTLTLKVSKVASDDHCSAFVARSKGKIFEVQNPG